MINIRLGPHGAFRIRAGCLLNRRQLVVGKIAVPVIHEVEIAGVSGRDDRLSQVHRFSKIESESLASMRRCKTIEHVVKRRDLTRAEFTVEDPDIDGSGNSAVEQSRISISRSAAVR